MHGVIKMCTWHNSLAADNFWHKLICLTKCHPHTHMRSRYRRLSVLIYRKLKILMKYIHSNFLNIFNEFALTVENEQTSTCLLWFGGTQNSSHHITSHKSQHGKYETQNKFHYKTNISHFIKKILWYDISLTVCLRSICWCYHGKSWNKCVCVRVFRKQFYLSSPNSSGFIHSHLFGNYHWRHESKSEREKAKENVGFEEALIALVCYFQVSWKNFLSTSTTFSSL